LNELPYFGGPFSYRHAGRLYYSQPVSSRAAKIVELGKGRDHG
jgi:hypothetical protein